MAATTELWTEWPLEFDTNTGQAGTPEYLNGVTVINPNLVTDAIGADGAVYNSINYLRAGGPVLNFQTNDIKEFLDECKGAGMLIDSAAANVGVVARFQKFFQGGTRSTGAAQFSCTIGDGMVIPRTLSIPHQGNAQLLADIFAVSTDGTTNPLVYDEAATLPVSVYPTTDELFTVGKVDHSGSAITGVMDMTYNFGITEQVLGADSMIYPTIFNILKIQPTMVIRTVEIDVTSTLTEAGVYDATGLVVYAKLRDAGATYVADVTASHIKMAFNKARIDVSSIGSGQLQMLITPVATPGAVPVDPVTWTIGSAIA